MDKNKNERYVKGYIIHYFFKMLYDILSNLLH